MIEDGSNLAPLNSGGKMTKQDIIREGIEELLENWLGGTAYSLSKKLSIAIVEYLHSQGVVIKVNEIKELTTTASESERFYAQGGSIALISSERTAHIFKALKGAGYEAVESLIEDK